MHAGGVRKKPAAAESDEIDPIAEADLFLQFGRDAQAEEILKDALEKNPSNTIVQLKLLSVYANRKDANNFSTIARKVKDSGDESAWEQAAALGRSIDPSNPMYGTGDAATAEPLSDTGSRAAAPALDMDIGFNIPMDMDITSAVPAMEAGTAETMDFDVSGAAGGSAAFDISGQADESMNFDVSSAQSASSMDFDISGSTSSSLDMDITGSHPNAVAAAVQEEVPLSGLAMDFDVTGSHPNVVAAAGQEEVPLSGLEMDFDVTGSHPDLVMGVGQGPDESLSNMSTDFDMTGSQPELTETQHMDFDMTGSHPSILAASSEEDNLNTVVLDSPMDLDISGSSPSLSFDSTAEASEDMGGGMSFDITGDSSQQSAASMDFDLSDGGLGAIGDEVTTMVSPVAEAKRDEKWQEVATKLDLARAYQEMGDVDGAREILNEVLSDGDEQQRNEAQSLMQQL